MRYLNRLDRLEIKWPGAVAAYSSLIRAVPLIFSLGFFSASGAATVELSSSLTRLLGGSSEVCGGASRVMP